MIRTDKSHLITVAQTHPGMSGKNNEDRFAVTAYHVSEKNPMPVLLAVLSDGIGGHRAGEIAAEIAVNCISQKVAGSDAHNPVGLLQQAIIEASARIYEEAQNSPERQGMGATCVAVLVLNNRLFAASVGDSRLYLIREGQIRKLSTDHTWIQEALEAGVLEPSQAEGHPNAHVIRRYLGSPNPPQVDIRLRLNDSETNAEAEGNQGFTLLPGDHLLLCSDGLSDLVQDQEILEMIQAKPVNEAVSALIDLANERGGHDNITIIVLQAPEKLAVREPKKKSKRWVVGCIGAVILAALLAGAIWGFLWYRGRRLLPAAATSTAAATEFKTLPAVPDTAIPSETPARTSTLTPPEAKTPVPVVPDALENGHTLTPVPFVTVLDPFSVTVTLPLP